MRLQFYLDWLKNKKLLFRQPAARELFADYVARIGPFSPVEIMGPLAQGINRGPATKLWLCDRGPGAKILSSEQLAIELERLLNGGIQVLAIGVGGADGFSAAQYEKLKPDLRWSFGPLTLPHELAAVVAAEQIYRAWSQIRNFPYHKQH